MLRKLPTIILTAAILSSGAAAVSAQETAKPAVAQKTVANKISVKLNGRPLVFPQDPVFYQGATYVNSSTLAKALDGSAAWDSTTKSLKIAKGKNLALRLFVDNPVAYKNGQKVKVPAQARPITGGVLVPLIFVAQELGAKVSFDSKTKTYNLIIKENH